MNLRDVAHQVAVSAFHNAGDRVTLLVERGAEQRIRVSCVCMCGCGWVGGKVSVGVGVRVGR